MRLDPVLTIIIYISSDHKPLKIFGSRSKSIHIKEIIAQNIFMMMMMMMIFMTIHENPNQPQNNQLCNEKEHSKETQRKQHDQNVDMIRMIRLEVMEMEAT